MMRYKVPGGVLKAGQARVLGEVAMEFARGPVSNPVFGDAFLDITTRQTVQMHWLRIEDIPEIWRRLEAAGMTTVQACGDSARNVLCCPVSGLDHEEVVDAYPVAQAINDYFTGNREYANLPRKFKMSVTGCLEDCGPGGDQRHRLATRPPAGRHDRFQRAGRRRSLRRAADGVGHRRVRAAGGGRGACRGASPRSSGSLEIGRTAGRPGCATWCRRSGRSSSAKNWTSARASGSRPPGKTSPSTTGATTSASTGRKKTAFTTSGST